MELRDYLKIITKSWSTVLAFTLAFAILVAVWSVMQPIKYEAGVTIVVNKPSTVPQRSADYFQYDKYYSIQASSLFADTLTAWLSSAGTAKEIFETANLPVPDVSLRKLGRIFKPRRQPPVTLTITVKDVDRARAEKLVKAAVAVLEERTAEARKNDDPDHYFALIAGPSVIAEVRQDILLNSLIGALAGLTIGTVAVFLREYLKRR